MNLKDDEDKIIFAKALDRLTESVNKEISTFTDFIDPARCETLILIFKKMNKREIKSFGGHENAERKIIGFIVNDEEIFPITPITFTFNAKFCKPPSHRDYLGAVLGLGLERRKIGDILLGENGATIFVSSDIAEYICENLKQAGRVAIKGKIGEVITSVSQSKEKRITVPSLRTDAVISSAFNLSRRDSSALIESEKVFVNGKPAKKTQLISAGDTITVRGKGRAVIKEQCGTTKKDRIVLQLTIN